MFTIDFTFFNINLIAWKMFCPRFVLQQRRQIPLASIRDLLETRLVFQTRLLLEPSGSPASNFNFKV